MSTPLTHDAMVRVKDGTGDWICVRCQRRGTIVEINAEPCPRPSTPKEQVQNLFDALEGKLGTPGGGLDTIVKVDDIE